MKFSKTTRLVAYFVIGVCTVVIVGIFMRRHQTAKYAEMRDLTGDAEGVPIKYDDTVAGIPSYASTRETIDAVAKARGMSECDARRMQHDFGEGGALQDSIREELVRRDERKFFIDATQHNMRMHDKLIQSRLDSDTYVPLGINKLYQGFRLPTTSVDKKRFTETADPSRHALKKPVLAKEREEAFQHTWTMDWM